MIDVAHDGHDRSTRQTCLGRIGLADKAFLHVLLGHALHGVAELRCDQLGGVGVDHIVDLHHLPLFHQELDDVNGALRHAVAEFLDCDFLWQLDLALDFDPLLLPTHGLQLLPFTLTFERSKAALLLLLVERIGQRQALTAGALGDGLLGRSRAAVRGLAWDSSALRLALFFLVHRACANHAVHMHPLGTSRGVQSWRGPWACGCSGPCAESGPCTVSSAGPRAAWACAFTAGTAGRIAAACPITGSGALAIACGWSVCLRGGLRRGCRLAAFRLARRHNDARAIWPHAASRFHKSGPRGCGFRDRLFLWQRLGWLRLDRPGHGDDGRAGLAGWALAG